MTLNEVEGFTDRDRLVGDLHYACKGISDEAMGYVVSVAQSMSLSKAPVGDRLVNEIRLVVHDRGEATMQIIWRYDAIAFLSSTYKRLRNGKWQKGLEPINAPWAVSLESRYQTKLTEIEAAVRQGQ